MDLLASIRGKLLLWHIMAIFPFPPLHVLPYGKLLVPILLSINVRMHACLVHISMHVLARVKPYIFILYMSLFVFMGQKCAFFVVVFTFSVYSINMLLCYHTRVHTSHHAKITMS